MASLIPAMGLKRLGTNLFKTATSVISSTESLSARVSRNLPALQTVQIRLKGHSKWQNIRHIKAANDLRIGRLCNKYTHLIGTAIREHGMEKNPEYNSALRKAIANARAEEVPKATIEAAIRKATNTSDQQELIFEMFGPGRCAVVIEMLSKNKHEGERSIRSSIKKIGGSFERGVLNMFQKKGIVTAKAPEMDWTFDKAENDAIESGAEEVDILEANPEDQPENLVFEFKCGPFEITTVRSFLEGQNYEVLSSGIFYIPNCYSSIDNDRDAAAAEAFIKALENCAGVTNVHHNIA